MQRIIVIHTPKHALAALKIASELRIPVILQSAPDAIFYAGSLYLLRMFEQAKQAYPDVDAKFILDCADAGAEAIAAMQTGHRMIRSCAPEALKTKLADIAKQYGVEMAEEPYESLDLLHTRDAQAACREWLKKSVQ